LPTRALWAWGLGFSHEAVINSAAVVRPTI